MGLTFDHVQFILNSNLIQGATETTAYVLNMSVSTSAPVAVFQGFVNPGFNGTFRWLEARLQWRNLINGTPVINYSWQLRTTASTVWTDMHTPVTTYTPAHTSVVETDIIFDAPSTVINKVPFEIRLAMSSSNAASSTKVTVVVNSTYNSIRVVGEAL